MRYAVDSRKRRFVGRLALSLAAAGCVVAGGAIGAGESPGEAASPVVLFNGTDLTGWKSKPHRNNEDHWTVGTPRIDAEDPRAYVIEPAEPGEGVLVNAKPHGVDLFSAGLFGDMVLELEVMVPTGSNSGIYLMGEYEVQVLDSFGKDRNPGAGDMGAIYGASPPRNPAYKGPGEWQNYRIEFRAPRFDESGRKSANARFVKIELNGRVIHENVELSGPTPGGLSGKEANKGPLMFQGDHGPVAIRGVTIRPLE